MSSHRSRGHVPSPLNLSSASGGLSSSPPQLLYELPNAPKSPKSPSRALRQSQINTKSPPRHLHNLSRPNSPKIKPTPPPRPQSLTQNEMNIFSGYCKAWYFNQDAEAGTQMEKILASVQPSDRADFTRVQAQIRSSYHAALAQRRKQEYLAHLSSTRPGGSLSPAARSNPESTLAREERKERLDRFLQTWSTHAGTKPFFTGLYAILRLQGLPTSLGGAGEMRMEWEVDDAVFRESAGKEFMLEAIDILKGVLGFEESSPISLSQPSTSLEPHIKSSTTVPAKERKRSKDPIPPPLPPRLFTEHPDVRGRSHSDPFQDDLAPVPSPSLMPLLNGSAGSPIPTRAGRVNDFELEATRAGNSRSRTPDSEDDDFEFPSPGGHGLGLSLGEDTPVRLKNKSKRRKSSSSAGLLSNPISTVLPSLSPYPPHDFAELRTWTVPAALGNPEISRLVDIFPDTISRTTVPRFIGGNARNVNLNDDVDLEAGDADGLQRESIRCGTGSIRISSKERGPGWRGSTWERFLDWWRRLFC